METPWRLREEDEEFFSTHLDSFVPERIYDIHAHLWRLSDWEGRPPEIVQASASEITLERYREYMAWIFPGREVHGLHFAYPAAFPNDPDPCNAWISGEVRKDPLARGQYYVRPTDDPDRTREEVKRLGLRGFKPFANFSGRTDIQNAEIPEFFPEWMARIAHEEGWSVTLHMQRPRSLADASNLHWIRTYCRRFPNMTLILDHAARGFNPYHVIEGFAKLGKLHNLNVDTSSVTSPLSIMACIEALGPSHVLYGSDIYISHVRGTNLPVGDSFLWLEDDAPVWKDIAYGGKPVLLGLENLRAIKVAAEVLRLSEGNVEQLFFGNASTLLFL